ncbi:Type VI secretion protein IcmF C-terminal [Methylomagnum ishizawai]|uniref:Type VI secretion protein IcmF C-terminal n=1 Tax=Methylomagnum ishizawai TaxID=1760988 RepID=A0A1Y6CVP1_9GAMM|nr:type VI secretion IcmF C-terminal domain-containing protein [Methylomagnum ishizawai]SMF94708.1 Type VI secretion protein IcmF C-terminal [Methylomagnum ishizawai]
MERAEKAAAALPGLLTWPEWLGLIVALVLVGVLAFLIWRRRGSGAGKPPAAAPSAPPLAANRLLKIWRSFESGIPLLMRRQALGTPLYVVVGEAGSGKTAMIDQYTHWQGQSYRFHPSATDDPLLQIYLGTKALVLEISASLLYNTGVGAYRALRRLWKNLPTSPEAIAVIDARTLLEPQPERLRSSAQALFGKLEVFGELEGEALPLTLALTHMDQVEGYAEFCAFLEESGIPLRLDFPEGDGLRRLATCLEGFEPHLSRALATRPAQDYLKIVGFLSRTPRLLEALAEFLRVAGLEQGALPCPIMRLCLLSEQTHTFGGHPFLPLPGDTPPPPPFKLGGHAKAALALAALGICYLVGSYRYQQRVLSDILERLDTVRMTPIERYPEKISPMFVDFSADLRKDPLVGLPNYFPNISDYARLRLIRDIRKYYLFPLLKSYQLEPDAPFRTNRMLALLYATPENKIGEMIATRMFSDPSGDMIRYKTLITDYVANNTHTEELDDILNSFDYAKSKQASEDTTQWLILFRELQQIIKKPYIRQAELTQVQQQSTELLQMVNRVMVYRYQPEIVEWLTHHTGLRQAIHTEYYSETQLRQEGIWKLLELLKHLRLDDAESCTPNIPLNDCLAQVQAVAQAKPEAVPTVMNFTLDGESFGFDSGQWTDLIARSRVTAMLRNIVYGHRSHDGWVFFEEPTPYPDIEMNPSNEGAVLFAGKGHIDGRLTADAFAQQVKPAVLALDTVIAKLPIDAEEKKHFGDFVLNNLRTYADRYATAYANYFRQFQVHIDSPWALKYVLNQIQQPNSPLLQALVQIKTNTALDLSGSTAFKGFGERLAAFRFIQRLMQEQNGTYPEFAKYQLLMLQMQTDLESQEPYAPKKSDEAGGFKKALSPMGRLAWGIMLNEESSYLRLTKAWLQNAGITDFWQQPFLAPPQKVGEFGSAEIKLSIDGIWNDLWNSNVQPMLAKFPFAPTAGRDREVSVNELTGIMHPKQGLFWTGFRDYLTPLCRYMNGAWGQRNELIGLLNLPEGMLARLNAAQGFSAMLWDDQGNPKPLPIAAKEEPLPSFNRALMPDAPLVSLGYLRAGGASVLAFNQQPAWQKFPLAWWQPQPAAVGLEFRADNEAVRTYADMSVADGTWNFFRLLQKGQATANNRYAWALSHPDFPQPKLTLEYTFQADPWLLFTSLAGS